MRRNPSACGLCKPHKKWKARDTRKTSARKKQFLFDFGTGVRLRELH